MHSPPSTCTSPARPLSTSRVPASEYPAPSKLVASPLISHTMLTTTTVGPPGFSSLALFLGVYSFSNFEASLLDQELNCRSAFAASFPAYHFFSEHAPVQSSSRRIRPRQTSLTNFDNARLLSGARSAAADDFSRTDKIEEEDLWGQNRDTCTLPTVIPFPSGPSSSKIRSKKCRTEVEEEEETTEPDFPEERKETKPALRLAIVETGALRGRNAGLL
mmetsp:Transcript_16091/g.36197  ORF Transcript_16091/g.36197 Transcript_16091/m.36197 type:complete len:218 (+) Transcript_16091:440-1093(+)